MAMVDTNWGWGLKPRSRAGLEWRPVPTIQAWLPGGERHGDWGWRAAWGGAVKAVWGETLQLPFRLLCARKNLTRELKGTIKKKWELRWWLLREQGETKNSKQLGVPGTKYEGVTRPVQWAEQKSSEGHSGVAERERQEWGSPGGSGRAETNRKGRGGGRRPSLKVDGHGNPSEESSLRNLGFQWPASGH